MLGWGQVRYYNDLNNDTSRPRQAGIGLSTETMAHLHTEPLTSEASPEAALQTEPTTFARLWPVLREIIETLVLATIIWVVINFATARYLVEGASMEPNLHTGEFLLVNRLSYRFDTPERGDIIVFHFPGNPRDYYVKRVIGLPGDEVVIAEGQVLVNDIALEEPYLDEGRSGVTPGPYHGAVPDGYYFVLGDNRRASSDSRSWGMLDEELIVGRAWFRYWPVSEWGPVEHYEYPSAQATGE